MEDGILKHELSNEYIELLQRALKMEKEDKIYEVKPEKISNILWKMGFKETKDMDKQEKVANENVQLFCKYLAKL